jgi:hypothetical protein
MNQQPRPFRVGQEGMSKLNGGVPLDGLQRVSLANDSGWVGFVRPDGTGLALFQPTKPEMAELLASMRAETGPPEDYLWGV